MAVVAVVLGFCSPLHAIVNGVPVLVYAAVVKASAILILIGLVDTVVYNVEIVDILLIV